MFDSGMGGISLLRNLMRLMPQERFLYYGDDGNAPYGTKTEREILALTRADAVFLLERDVKALVIACNTATSAAAQTLRSELELPIIGMEPALKPAALDWVNGTIAVLATPATLRQRKFALLMEKYGQHAIPLPCPGLVEFVERGELEGEALRAFLKRTFEPLSGVELSGVVLGCTHYTFVKRAIADALGGARLYDGNEGTARQLKNVLEARGLEARDTQGGVELFTSGDQARVLPIMRFLLEQPIE